MPIRARWGTRSIVTYFCILTIAPVVNAAPKTQPDSTTTNRATASATELAPKNITLMVAGNDKPATYWIREPAGYGKGQKPPLLIVLHGTDDTARDMIHFWGQLRSRLPLLIAAPQGKSKGWCDEDVATINAMLADLQAKHPYDPHRVFLAGFSAGGAMSFHLLYAEKFAASAVAALANYVPPRITDEQVRARRDVPVFYAVGMTDVNHELMREGIDRIRSAGGDVELYRPHIGHILSAEVAQTAMDWLFDRAARQISAAIEQYQTAENKGVAALQLEDIVAQFRWHEQVHVQAASQALEQLEAPGWRDLQNARGLLAAGQPLDTLDLCQQVQAAYGTSRVGREAKNFRLRIEADPQIRRQWAERDGAQRAELAQRLYAGAQRLVAERKLREAADRCQQIIDHYSDTASAERARHLLTLLKPGIGP